MVCDKVVCDTAPGGDEDEEADGIQNQKQEPPQPSKWGKISAYLVRSIRHLGMVGICQLSEFLELLLNRFDLGPGKEPRIVIFVSVQ